MKMAEAMAAVSLKGATHNGVAVVALALAKFTPQGMPFFIMLG